MIRNVGIFASEFFARGLLWARVLILAGLMPVSEFGMVVVLLGVEGTIAAVASYPVNKDTLVRSDSSFRPIRQFTLLLLCLLPVVILAWSLWDFDRAEVLVVVMAAALNGIGQVALCILRISDVALHTYCKLAGVVAGTVFFLVLVPHDWVWLPAAYLPSALFALIAVLNVRRTSNRTVAKVSAGYIASGWMIYGMQAILGTFPQQGIRVFVAHALGLVQVAAFTKSFMLATGVFFIHSALMIVFEPRLSRMATPAEALARLPLVKSVLGWLVGSSVIYGLALALAIHLNLLEVFALMLDDEEMMLVAVFFVYILFNCAFAAFNPLVLAMGGRRFSMQASAVGFVATVAILVSTYANPNLHLIAWAITLGQLVTIVYLVFSAWLLMGPAR